MTLLSLKLLVTIQATDSKFACTPNKIRSNRESGDGRYDIGLIPRESRYPGIIMELKWKKDLSEEALDDLANEALAQIKHKKVDGAPPGEELKAYSYSIAEFGELLEIPSRVAYDLLKRYNLENFEVDTWKRIRKDVFEKWYRSQTKYRTHEDRMRDAEPEEASMTLPQSPALRYYV